jgi:DNA polymerase I-like protein with 3'-5' exonuclease and polymerase domains
MGISGSDRVIIMAATLMESNIKRLFAERGVTLSNDKYFFCASSELFPQVDNIVSGPLSWANISAQCEGSTTPEKIDHIFNVLGKSVGTKNDCFATPVPEGMTTNITFPPRVDQYFPDPAERAAFIQKSMTETQRHAVNQEVLEAFAAKGEPIAKALLALRGDIKMLGTYFETDGSGMMSLINEIDSCIHHELSLCHTTTSRMASANPNMQNIPKEEDLRNLFISRFGKDGILLEADYNQLEVVVMCAVAKDPQMTEDLGNNVDFHCKRVTMMRPGVTYEEVVKKAKHEKDPEFVALRQRAKVFSFQRQYGAGVNKLAESTGLTQDEVRALIKNEETTYWRVKLFYDMVNFAVSSWAPKLQDGTRTASGQIAYSGEFRIPTGTRFTFGEIERSQESRAAFEGSPMTFLSTQIKNYPVQGFAGEIVQVMLGRLWRHFVKMDNYGGKAYLTNTVHDCVWVDCHRDVAVQVGEDVQRILSEVKQVFNERFPELGLQVSFGTEVVVGPTMSNMKGIHTLKKA